MIGAPSGVQTKVEKNSLAANSEMSVGTKNMIVFCSNFSTVSDWFKSTVIQIRSHPKVLKEVYNQAQCNPVVLQWVPKVHNCSSKILFQFACLSVHLSVHDFLIW